MNTTIDVLKLQKAARHLLDHPTEYAGKDLILTAARIATDDPELVLDSVTRSQCKEFIFWDVYSISGPKLRTFFSPKEPS